MPTKSITALTMAQRYRLNMKKALKYEKSGPKSGKTSDHQRLIFANIRHFLSLFVITNNLLSFKMKRKVKTAPNRI